MSSFWMPNKKPLYAPMIASFGGGSSRGFGRGGRFGFRWISHTFTNAGANGIVGPTPQMVQSAYAGSQAYDEGAITSSQYGTQSITIPKSGTYFVILTGANGGSNKGECPGGRGATVELRHNFSKGQILNVIVGQGGMHGGNGTGGHGGGATWLFSGEVGSGTLYGVAGGGGGGGHDVGFGGDGSTTAEPTAAGGRGNGGWSQLGYGGNHGSTSGGESGSWNAPAGGGAGWFSDGGSLNDGSYQNIGRGGFRVGTEIFGGWLDGPNNNTPPLDAGTLDGGYGGGGGGGGNGLSGGGGGGYTGGGGGNNWPGTGNPGHGGGQGGGSYVAPTASFSNFISGGNTGENWNQNNGSFSASGSLFIQYEG